MVCFMIGLIAEGSDQGEYGQTYSTHGSDEKFI
jgi:hypothetical protein